MKIEGWANIYDEVNFTFNQSVFIYPTKKLANLAHKRSGPKHKRITKGPFLVQLEIPDQLLRINSQDPEPEEQEKENVCK